MVAKRVPKQTARELTEAELASYRQVLNTIRRWPSTLQIDLAQSILGFIREDTLPHEHKRGSSEQIAGRWQTDKPAPTDEEVEQMLEEARLERYYGQSSSD